jgi:hypothetical protein
MPCFRASPAALLAALSLTACGARSELPTLAGPPDGGPPDAGPPDAGHACPRPLGAAFIPSGPTGFACSFDPAAGSAPALAVVAGLTLIEITQAGVPTPVFTFFADAPGVAATPGNGRGQVASRGAYYGAIRTAPYPVMGGVEPVKARVEIVIRKWGGGTVFHDASDTDYKNFGNPIDGAAIGGNEAGMFVYGYGFGDLGATEVVSVAEGQAPQRSGLYPTYVPMGDPDEAGVVPVALADTSSTGSLTFLWLDPCTGTATPTAYADAVLGAKLLHLDRQAGTLLLSSAHADATLPLPSAFGNGSIFDVHPSGWTLLYAGGSQFLAANVAKGAVAPIDMTLPPGLQRLPGFTENPGYDETLGEVAVASDGSIVMPLRDSQAAHLFRHAGKGAWTPAGAPLGGLLSVQGFEQGGSLIGFANDWATTPPTGWPPPSGGRVDGTSVELTRPDSNVTVIVEHTGIESTWGDQGHAFSADGGCLSYWAGATLTVAAATTGQIRPFDLSSFPGASPFQVAASAWYASPDRTMFPH